jgi:hypothetical protein
VLCATIAAMHPHGAATPSREAVDEQRAERSGRDGNEPRCSAFSVRVRSIEGDRKGRICEVVDAVAEVSYSPGVMTTY